MVWIASVSVLAASVLLVGGLVWLGSRRPGYSHLGQTISELGEVGAPDQRLVAFGLFLPVGGMLAVAAGLLVSMDRPASALAGCLAMGYLGAAVLPCDRGSPLFGSWRQFGHNLAGAIQYVGGGRALIELEPEHGAGFGVAGWVVLGAVPVLGMLQSGRGWGWGRGLVQRVAELGLFGGLAMALLR